MHETVRQIKAQLRLFMNGVLSQSLREKGLKYRLIFGVELPRLKEIAAGYEQNHELAQALWNEDIRECKILAAYLQPTDTFAPELADYLCMGLFRRLPYASQKAFQWIASENRIEIYTGFRLISHLFVTLGTEMNERGRNEFIDQAQAALQGDDLLIKQAAQSALDRLTINE